MSVTVVEFLVDDGVALVVTVGCTVRDVVALGRSVLLPEACEIWEDIVTAGVVVVVWTGVAVTPDWHPVNPKKHRIAREKDTVFRVSRYMCGLLTY